jgi:glycosyltransferase involved in cell wall biosynthesis
MRILHIDTGREMRGGQWQALHLIAGLAERGISSRLLAPPESALFQAATAVNLDAHPLKLARSAAVARHFDLIHAHDARAHTLALFIALFRRCPVVVSRRVAFPIGRAWISRWKYNHATHYLAVSEYVRNMLGTAGVPCERISVVYDGVRLPDRVDAGSRSFILALDSDDPRKGKLIVEKASGLAGVPVHFSHHLLEDLPRSIVFVYITDLEGLGSAALLAMASGAPVIASAVGGLPEIVLDGETGLLTENTPRAVASTLQRLLADQPLAQRLATRARAMVERRFTISHMVENTLRVYERVLH